MASGMESESNIANKSGMNRTIAVLFAILLTAGALAGYTALRWRHAKRVKAEEDAKKAAIKPVPVPDLQVFVDEARLKGANAVVGGTVENISQTTFEALSVELELKRRKDGGSEIRTLPLQPDGLAPGQRGRYELMIPSSEYRDARLVRIVSGQRAQEVVFKTAPGTQRPPEYTPSGKSGMIRPEPRRQKGDEFINTQDNPITIR